MLGIFSPEIDAALIGAGILIAGGILAWMFSVNEKLTKIASSVGFLVETVKEHKTEIEKIKESL